MKRFLGLFLTLVLVSTLCVPTLAAEAPKLDYVKTVQGVTFSNYIRYTERQAKDANGNRIQVYHVFTGENAAMRSDAAGAEFVCTTEPGGSRVPSLDDLGIAVYDDSGKGLTWVFHELGVYSVCVRQGGSTTYFQVNVTTGTNFSGDRVYEEPSAPEPSAPAKEALAIPNTSPVYVNHCLTEFEAYNIAGNNYFKLRDVALVLRNTEKQFQVTWNPSYQTVIDGKEVFGSVEMISNKGYTPVGGEMSRGNGLEKLAVLTNSPLLKDGVRVTTVVGYNINGNNFFKLRDLGRLFDFNVSWDSSLRSIIVTTAESYDDLT